MRFRMGEGFVSDIIVEIDRIEFSSFLKNGKEKLDNRKEKLTLARLVEITEGMM